MSDKRLILKDLSIIVAEDVTTHGRIYHVYIKIFYAPI